MRAHFAAFSLIELLIALSIIGIVLIFSFPLYTHYQVQENRLEAASVLANLAFAMETYYIEHQTYKDVRLKDLQFDEIVVRGNYRLIIKNKNHHYFLQAIPLHKQAQKDTACGTLTLTENGQRGITGHGQLESCW